MFPSARHVMRPTDRALSESHTIQLLPSTPLGDVARVGGQVHGTRLCDVTVT